VELLVHKEIKDPLEDPDLMESLDQLDLKDQLESVEVSEDKDLKD